MTKNDKITVIIHTENETKLLTLLNQLHQHPLKSQFNTLQVNCKGITPWTNPTILDKISTLTSSFYSIQPTSSSPVLSLIDLIYKIKTNYVLIIDESNTCFNIKEWDILNNTYLLAKTTDLLHCNQDTNYQHITWFIADLISQKTRHKFNLDNTSDSERYFKKIDHPLFYERIIHVHGGLGDHVMAYPLLEKIGKKCFVSSIYPFVLDHIDTKGLIDWNDDLFGGYHRFIYDYGLVNDLPNLVNALFEMYNIPKEKTDVMKYNGPKIKYNNISGKPIVLVGNTAARVQGFESNKNWVDVRWFNLIFELKKLGYHVIQTGSHKDDQIPLSFDPNSPYCQAGVDEKFLDKSIPELAGLIEEASLWITVDTFLHPFAASIKPETGICLIPFYNDYVKHPKVTYIEKDCGKNYHNRRWLFDFKQPERKESLELIQVDDILKAIKLKTNS